MVYRQQHPAPLCIHRAEGIGQRGQRLRRGHLTVKPRFHTGGPQVCPFFRVQPMAPQHRPWVRAGVVEYGLDVKPCSPRHAPGLKRRARCCLVCKCGYAHISDGACCHFVCLPLSAAPLPPYQARWGILCPPKSPARRYRGLCGLFLDCGQILHFSDFSGLTFCLGYATLKVRRAPASAQLYQLPCVIWDVKVRDVLT